MTRSGRRRRQKMKAMRMKVSVPLGSLNFSELAPKKLIGVMGEPEPIHSDKLANRLKKNKRLFRV